jgi:hypothetical protein
LGEIVRTHFAENNVALSMIKGSGPQDAVLAAEVLQHDALGVASSLTPSRRQVTSHTASEMLEDPLQI